MWIKGGRYENAIGWHLQVAAMMLGGAHAIVRDLLNCCKRLLAWPGRGGQRWREGKDRVVMRVVDRW